MTQETGTYLDRIIADKREEVAAARRRTPASAIERLAGLAPAARSFRDALKREKTVALIAEVKRASPSRGLLRADFDHLALAWAYAQGGAAAISVLTDTKHFQGALSHLLDIRQIGEDMPPLLRKDFLFDPYQVYEGRAHGADAVLLIAAVLEPSLLADMIALAEALGMDALVEVHDEREVEQAAAAGAQLIGINNRDLRTFTIDLGVTERLRPLVREATVVAESGVLTRADVLRMQASGVDAMLIGEALVTAKDPGAKISELFST